jgi:anaerobic magnesium-protoporphyrin IX monomethyl ester cyclase
MHVVFIYNGAENLGLEYLSSFLKSKGHRVSLLLEPDTFGDQLLNNHFLAKHFNLDQQIVRRAQELAPDLIGFSVYTGNYAWCLKLSRAIKQRLPAVPIVFGGAHTSSVPEHVLAHDWVDYVVVGEGEFALLDLVDHLAGGASPDRLSATPNLGFRLHGKVQVNPPRPYLRELDQLPLPDKELFLEKIPYLEDNYFILASRGCPFSCTYCGNDLNHRLYGSETQHVRRRSVENVLAELRGVKRRGRARLIAFCDDVFTSSRAWLEEFLPRYRDEIGIPFFCNAHPASIDPGIAAQLKAAGCWMITMGVQSGS